MGRFQPPAYHIVWIMDLDGAILGFVSELELINTYLQAGLNQSWDTGAK